MDMEAIVRKHIGATCKVRQADPPPGGLYCLDDAARRKAAWYAISWGNECWLGPSHMIAVLDGKVVFDGWVGE